MDTREFLLEERDKLIQEVRTKQEKIGQITFIQELQKECDDLSKIIERIKAINEAWKNSRRTPA